MRPELREQVIAYNKAMLLNEERAADMMVIAEELAKLPPGQLKKVLTEKVKDVLIKYGIEIA